jgi:uncharacterized membrane protein YtjA (UPF0391 family)
MRIQRCGCGRLVREPDRDPCLRLCVPLKGRPFTEGEEEQDMLYYALMFLIVGLVAGALGLFGVAEVASRIAWVLFLIGVVILVIHLVSGRSTRAL